MKSAAPMMIVNWRITERIVILVGDSAHGIHPVAGQGLNLGLRDAATLVELVAEHASLGLDCGAVGAVYERARRGDNAMIAMATDGFERLFSNESAVLQIAHRSGLHAFSVAPILQSLIADIAMGSAR